jgi:hypothetical protein
MKWFIKDILKNDGRELLFVLVVILFIVWVF